MRDTLDALVNVTFPFGETVTPVPATDVGTMPVIAVAGLFGAIFTATDMTVVYVLTRGGPNNATQVLSSWAYFKGIEGSDIAQGAAIALFLFPLLLFAAIAILRAVRRMEVF